MNLKTLKIIYWLSVIAALVTGFNTGIVYHNWKANKALKKVHVKVLSNYQVVIDANAFFKNVDKIHKQSMLRPTPGTYRRLNYGEARERVYTAHNRVDWWKRQQDPRDPTIAQLEEIIRVLKEPKPPIRTWRETGKAFPVNRSH